MEVVDGCNVRKKEKWNLSFSLFLSHTEEPGKMVTKDEGGTVGETR